jgi:DNA-binding SARP family transcriptional activator
MAARCRIELFGGLRIIQGDRTLSRFRTRKTAALLAYLTYHPDRSHPREVLVELLWPWANPAAGRHSLSCALSSLRHQLEPPGVPEGAVIMADTQDTVS